jgi:hypothetical protein
MLLCSGDCLAERCVSKERGAFNGVRFPWTQDVIEDYARPVVTEGV